MIVPELFPESREDNRVASEAVEFAAASDFYSAVELTGVSDGEARLAIARSVSGAGMRVTYWVTKPQQDSGLSISSPDEEERRAAVKVITDRLRLAAECKADHVAIQSGRDVRAEDRRKAKEQLHRSVREIHRAAAEYGPMRLLLEPVDRDGYKRYLIGPAREAVDFVSQMRKEGVGIDLGLDAAHLRLQGEELLEELPGAAAITSELHLSNCVDDPGAPGFGDHHIPPGEPGFLTEEYVESVLRKGLEADFFGPARPILSVENVGPGGEGSWELERVGREMMIRAWRRVLEGGPWE